jgi:hypothetical protein
MDDLVKDSDSFLDDENEAAPDVNRIRKKSPQRQLHAV